MKDFLQILAQSGYLGITVPQEYGGQGAPLLHFALFVEALSEYEPGLALMMASHGAVIELLQKFGDQTQKSRYLPLLGRGDGLGAFAVSEEQAGTDFEAAVCKAVRDADKLSLRGKKSWVVNGELAGLFIVLARLENSEQETGNLALLLVEASARDGLTVSPNKPRLGLRSAPVNDLDFDGLTLLAESALLPSPEPVCEQVLQGMDIAKVLVSAGAIGIIESLLGQSVDYAKERQQFGKNIGQFQAVQWKLADMSVESLGARLLTYRAAWSKDEDPDNFRQNAAMCKWLSTKAARVQSGEALQILATRGLIAESPAERFYRDAKTMEIAEGTSEFQRILIARELGVDAPLE